MTSIQEETLKGYPGAALIIKADGTIEKTNDKGTAFSSLIAQNKLDALRDGAMDAMKFQIMSVENIMLESGKGIVSLEATFLPFQNGNKGNDFDCIEPKLCQIKIGQIPG